MLSATRSQRNHRLAHTKLILALCSALRSERAANANLRDEIVALLADRALLLNDLGDRDDKIDLLEDALCGKAVPL